MFLFIILTRLDLLNKLIIPKCEFFYIIDWKFKISDLITTCINYSNLSIIISASNIIVIVSYKEEA